MCGIAGIINYYDIDLNRIISALKHRGPDDQTIYTDKNVALLHARLAIQDVTNGTQPFHHEHFSIIFNGEIYNHLSLRKLIPEFQFKTYSDTETLLYLFIKFKEKMFELLDGMFAFCIYDKENNKIYLARDRAGKKPLYYYKTDNFFIFASELNAIKSVTNLTHSPEAITSYLRTGFLWTPHTVYDSVNKLDAASYIVINIDTLDAKKTQYFNMLDCYQNSENFNLTFEQTISNLENKLQQSIEDRIKSSDVEVGVFLSGGIDSNLIAAIAAQIKPNIKTFTVKFDGLYNESSLAKITASQYKTDHYELTIHDNLSQEVEKILLSYGEPFMDSSAIPSYYVSREARKNVKVILGGDGADELFGGYRRYVPLAYSLNAYIKFLNPFLNFLPKAQTKQSLYNYLYRLIAMSNKTGLDFYLSATTDLFEDIYKFKNTPITHDLDEFINSVMSNIKLSPLKKMLYLDFSIILFCDLLVKMDIASMANSLEVRSPFLSKYLLEFAPTLPDHFKIKKFKTKFILRKLAEKYLSKELVSQPKRGFEVPLKKWVDSDLRENIFDRLKPGCYASNFVDAKFIDNLLHKKLDISMEKRAKILWSLYCLEVWHQNESQNSFHRKLSTVTA